MSGGGRVLGCVVAGVLAVVGAAGSADAQHRPPSPGLDPAFTDLFGDASLRVSPEVQARGLVSDLPALSAVIAQELRRLAPGERPIQGAPVELLPDVRVTTAIAVSLHLEGGWPVTMRLYRDTGPWSADALDPTGFQDQLRSIGIGRWLETTPDVLAVDVVDVRAPAVVTFSSRSVVCNGISLHPRCVEVGSGRPRYLDVRATDSATTSALFRAPHRRGARDTVAIRFPLWDPGPVCRTEPFSLPRSLRAHASTPSSYPRPQLSPPPCADTLTPIPLPPWWPELGHYAYSSDRTPAWQRISGRDLLCIRSTDAEPWRCGVLHDASGFFSEDFVERIDVLAVSGDHVLLRRRVGADRASTVISSEAVAWRTLANHRWSGISPWTMVAEDVNQTEDAVDDPAAVDTYTSHTVYAVQRVGNRCLELRLRRNEATTQEGDQPERRGQADPRPRMLCVHAERADAVEGRCRRSTCDASE